MISQVLADGSAIEVSEEAYVSLGGAAMRVAPEETTVMRGVTPRGDRFVALRIDGGHGCIMEVVWPEQDGRDVGSEMAAPGLIVADEMPGSPPAQ